MAAAAEPPRHPQGLPVLIIGAGSCGLAIAHGLKKASVPYRVFEQDPSAAPRKARDWAVGCHWSSSILADLLGPEKWARIAETQTDPHRPTPAMDMVPVVHGATGDIVRRLPFPRFYRLLRSRLRAFMADGVDVAYAKKLVNITYAAAGEPATVTAHFADGTTATGRLLLGADGGRSRVRSLLLEPEHAALKRLPLAATFINCSGYTREKALYLRRLHPVVSAAVHPDGMMAMLTTLDAAQADRPETWTFAFYISWQTPVEEQDAEAAVMGPRERLRQSKEKSRCFAEPIHSAYEWMPDDLDTVYYTPNANWDPSLPEHRWDNHAGLVTLVGDAAHPMTYHRGQGLNHALEDAGRIVKLLVQSPTMSQSELIGEYENEMRTRAGEEVRLSETNSFMMHDWDRMMHSPLMTASLAKGGDTFINGHCPSDE